MLARPSRSPASKARSPSRSQKLMVVATKLSATLQNILVRNIRIRALLSVK
jgi:hypothetical protein